MQEQDQNITTSTTSTDSIPETTPSTSQSQSPFQKELAAMVSDEALRKKHQDQIRFASDKARYHFEGILKELKHETESGHYTTNHDGTHSVLIFYHNTKVSFEINLYFKQIGPRKNDIIIKDHEVYDSYCNTLKELGRKNGIDINVVIVTRENYPSPEYVTIPDFFKNKEVYLYERTPKYFCIRAEITF